MVNIIDYMDTKELVRCVNYCCTTDKRYFHKLIELQQLLSQVKTKKGKHYGRKEVL